MALISPDAGPVPAQDLPAWSFARATEIDAAASFAELEAAMRKAADELGFKEYFLVEVTAAGASIVVGRTETPLLARRTGATQLREDDIIHQTARTTVAPFFYSDVLAKGPLSDRDRANAALRLKAGILDGFVGTRHRSRDKGACAMILSGRAIPDDPALRLAITQIVEQYGATARRLRGAPAPPDPKLTQRQIDCLQWAARGKSAADIGKILGLSPHTVHAHVADACAKLDVRTRVQAVAAAVTLGLLSP